MNTVRRCGERQCGPVRKRIRGRHSSNDYMANWRNRNDRRLVGVCLDETNSGRRHEMNKRLTMPCAAALALMMGLAACTNPNDPGQRAAGGALLGAGAGAALGAAAGGGRGAGTGALIGGAVGALGGVATTPTPPPRAYYPPP